MELSTCNLNHSVVSQRFEDLRRQEFFGTSLSSGRELASSEREDISISRQVHLMVFARDHLLEMPHILQLVAGIIHFLLLLLHFLLLLFFLIQILLL